MLRIWIVVDGAYGGYPTGTPMRPGMQTERSSIISNVLNELLLSIVTRSSLRAEPERVLILSEKVLNKFALIFALEGRPLPAIFWLDRKGDAMRRPPVLDNMV